MVSESQLALDPAIPVASLLALLAGNLETVQGHLRGYETARLSAGRGHVSDTHILKDLQQLDRAIQMLGDVSALTKKLAEGLPRDLAVEAVSLTAVVQLETYHDLLRAAVAGADANLAALPNRDPVELF